MTTVLQGNRIGATARLSVACSGFLFDTAHRLLLVQRRDNSDWALPGGMVEPGESLTEACVREVEEETGFTTVVAGIAGMSSEPHRVMTYADGTTFQCVELDFLLTYTGGHWRPSAETRAIAWVTLADLATLNLMETETWRVRKALRGDVPYWL